MRLQLYTQGSGSKGINISMKHYLMIKTHNKTGLKYLCKTSTSDPAHPYKYKGSGKYWKRHLQTHGKDITTEVIGEYTDKQEFIRNAIYFSERYNVVESDDWANLIPERGDGGPTMLGRSITPEQNKRKSEALKRFYENASDEYKTRRSKINRECHEKYRYFTPKGIFTNAFKAAEVNDCSNVTIINRCIKDTKKPIQSRKYWKYGWKGKTWEELGWSYEEL